MISSYKHNLLLTSNECFAINGITNKGGMSHSHDFCVSEPYMYPLFKIHKLNKTQIEEKVIPPTRMVTSCTNGPTYRLGLFIDAILQPVAKAYCKGELVKDNRIHQGNNEIHPKNPKKEIQIIRFNGR